MTCKDCLHYEACNAGLLPFETDDEDAKRCKEFAGKTEWVHLPCHVGAPVYVNCSTWGGLLAYCVPKYINGEPFASAAVVSVIITKKQKFIKLKAITKSGRKMFQRYPFSSFGITIFSTREEAEKVLAERSGE